jgi:hypothetical protein
MCQVSAMRTNLPGLGEVAAILSTIAQHPVPPQRSRHMSFSAALRFRLRPPFWKSMAILHVPHLVKGAGVEAQAKDSPSLQLFS